MSRRPLLAAALPLALAACAGNAPRSAPPQGAAVPAPARASAAHPPKKVSPYAPAQEDPSKRGDYVAGGLFRPGEADSVPDEIPDVDAIPEPEVRDEPRSRSGNRDYAVLGKRYRVMDSADGYVEEGNASYYGKKFHGRRTSSGEVYDMYAFSAAHKTLPLPSYARVTNLDNGRSVVVRINDRGPFHSNRIIDLSYAAAVKLGYRNRGTARVEVRALAPGDTGPLLAGPAAPKPAPAAVDTRYRFDMRQDGKVMTADEFDAWMQSRRVRVATGKPGRPDPAPAAPAAPAAPSATAASEARPVAPPPPSPVTAAALVAATAAPRPAAPDQVTLQVASFADQRNAQHALALLQGAEIARAQLFDADVGGRRIWRLRIGPVAAASAPELAARIVGLGFGQPQRVRD